MTRQLDSLRRLPIRAAGLAASSAVCLAAAAQSAPAPAPAAPVAAPGACQPLYLALETGHLESAPMLVEALHTQGVTATFFSANEKQKNGKTSLDRAWGPWWKARAREGHDTAARTWDRVEWNGDLPGREPRFRMRIHDGAFAGREFTWKGSQYCENLDKSAERLNYYTGKPPLQLFHVEGRASPRLLETAQSCGYKHVNWTPASFLVSKDWIEGKKPYDELTRNALKALPPQPVLLVGTSMWEGHDGWVTGGMLKQFIGHAKALGYCFKPLREHPDYLSWLQEHPFEDKP